MLTRTLNLVQKYGITVHANLPCKILENIVELGLGFAERNLTLTIDNSANNTLEIGCMHKVPNR